MKLRTRIAPTLLAAAFVLTSLAGCAPASKAGAGTLSPDVTGEFVPFEGEEMKFSPVVAKRGTDEQLTAWNESLTATEKDIAYIYVASADDNATRKPLSSEQMNGIIAVLKEGKPVPFVKTAGEGKQSKAVDVVAMNKDKALMWHISYDGEWMIIELDGSIGIYDAANSGLEELREYIVKA